MLCSYHDSREKAPLRIKTKISAIISENQEKNCLNVNDVPATAVFISDHFKFDVVSCGFQKMLLFDTLYICQVYIEAKRRAEFKLLVQGHLTRCPPETLN